MTLLQLANKLSDYMDPSLDPYARECLAYSFLWTASRGPSENWFKMWSKPLSDSNPEYQE